MTRRPHPMTLFAITCELRANADVYGWEPIGQPTPCQYCETPAPTPICAQCRADLEIPPWVIA